MKAILEFSLPDDDYKHRLAVMADDLGCFIWDFEQYLRGQVKYGDPPDDIEKIYDRWFELKPELPQE